MSMKILNMSSAPLIAIIQSDNKTITREWRGFGTGDVANKPSDMFDYDRPSPAI